MTTTFQTPLQTGDYTKLRGTAGNVPWSGNQYITLCKNTIVFQGQIAAASSLPSIAQFAYNNVTVGAYTDVEIGETLLISHDNNIRHAFWRGRIRKAPDATFVYMNETSVNLTIGDYVFVVYDFDHWDVLSRMVGSTQYWDYDIAYHPLAPISAGLQTAYINYDPADGTYRIAFDVRASKATDEHSTPSLSYQFTFVAGTYTVFAGSLSSPLVTVDLNANTEQWGKLVVTDSQGTTCTRRFYIRAHGSTDSPALDFNGAQITGNLDSGYNATVSAWDGVDSVLGQTFTVIWSKEWYDNVEGPIFNNIDMVGRFHRETNEGHGDPLYSYVTDVQFDIEGICTQLQRLQMQDLTTIDKGTAAVIDEISFNTPQRSIVYYLATHSTALTLCDLTFPNGFDLTYLFQYIPNQGGNILDAVQGIAKQFGANVEFAPDGRIQVVIDTRFLSDKSGVVDVADWNNQDFTTINLPVDPVNKTGRLDASGAVYNSGVTQADRSRAPGSAQDYAAGQSTLDAQILKATSNNLLSTAELDYRAGQQMAIENLTYTQDWKAAHGGYHFLIPSRGQRVTHTLSTETNVRDLAFTSTDYWQVVSITINHDNASGGREVTTTEELEPPPGDPGDTVPQIGGGTQTNIALLQPADPFPSLPDNPVNYLPDDPTPNPYPPLIPPKNGNTGIYTDGAIIDTSRSLLRRIPVWTGANPSDLSTFSAKDVAFDLTTINPPIGAYDVESDGTNSEIQYTPDAFAKPTVWTPTGTAFSGVYEQIRSANVPGSALIYTSNNGANKTVYDFKVSDQGFTVDPDPSVAGTYVALTGWDAADPGISDPRNLGLNRFFTAQSISTVILDFTNVVITNDPNPSLRNGFIQLLLSGSPVATSANTPIFTGETRRVYSGAPVMADEIRFIYQTSSDPANYNTGSLTCVKVTVNSGGAEVRSTSDYGATVGSAITVGDPPPSGGFDLIRIGGTSIAAAVGQVKIATSLGGSYSNAPGGTLSAGNPCALVIPIRKWDLSARQDNSSTPDYLLGADADNSGACLWRVTGAGSLTDITPISGAFCVGPNLATVWQTGTTCHILATINDGGTLKVMRSTNNGTSWTLSKTVTNPIYLRYNRTGNPVLYLLDGSDLWLSLNHGISWVKDTLPSSNVGVAFDSYS